jgi:hypothetical protein
MSGRRIVVADDERDIILNRFPCCRHFVWQKAPSGASFLL